MSTPVARLSLSAIRTAATMAKVVKAAELGRKATDRHKSTALKRMMDLPVGGRWVLEVDDGQHRHKNPFKPTGDGICVTNPLSVREPEIHSTPQGSLLPWLLSVSPHGPHMRIYDFVSHIRVQSYSRTKLTFPYATMHRF